MAPRRDPLNADDILRRLAGSSGGGGSSSSSDGPVKPEAQVFFGQGKMQTPVRPKTQKASPFYQGGRKPGNMVEAEVAVPLAPKKGRDDVRGLSAAQGEFYAWDDAQRKKWAAHLVAIGYIDPEDASDYTVLLKAWNEVIGEAANFTGAGKKIDPWKVAELIAGTDNEGGGSGGKTRAGRERGFTGSKSTRSTNVDLTDPETAKSLVNDTLTKFLGRRANDEEVRAFTSVLNSAEQKNPTITDTTTSYVDGEATGQTATSSGGLTAAGKGQIVDEQAMARPDYAEYQAASTYMNALMGSMGTVGGN